MKLYLINIIKRLNQFSASLDKQEIFVDKPWVFIDENSNQQKYIFKRDGSLIMSLNGQVTLGRWEYIPGAKSLLIDRIQDKILLNQNFIDSAVMILKKDGLKDDYFILANELLIPDLNVTIYLKNLYYEKNYIQSFNLGNDEFLEIHNYRGIICNNEVTLDGEPVAQASYIVKQGKIIINNSKIVKVYTIGTYHSNIGTLKTEQESQYLLKGDKVFINNIQAPDGKYSLGYFRYFTVKNGEVNKTSTMFYLDAKIDNSNMLLKYSRFQQTEI